MVEKQERSKKRRSTGGGRKRGKKVFSCTGALKGIGRGERKAPRI